MATLFQQFAPRDPAAAIGQIPVIDFGPFFAGEPGTLEPLAAQVRAACETVGFFYLKGHGVPQALIDRIFEQDRRFHALPLEEKLALALNENNIGYLPMNASIQKHSTVHRNTKPNANESFFVSHDRSADHASVIAGEPLRGQNKWPAGLPGFREVLMAYFDALYAVGQRMLPVFARALDLPADFFAPYFAGEGHANLRLLHYPAQKIVGENEFGTAPHTDNSFMTLLARMDVPGLAIRLPSGEWVSPPLIPGTYLVNLGNIMRRWSNDRFLSTPHAVIVEGERDRYSIAYFHSPNPDVTIEPVTRDGEPTHYPPAVYRDLVLEFYRANYFHQQKQDAAD